MNLSLAICEFSDEEISAEYVRRCLGTVSLDDVSENDLLQEIEDRGLEIKILCEVDTDDLTYEFQKRNLESIEVDDDRMALANSILNAMNDKECFSNRVTLLIETMTGKSVCV